MTRTCYQFLLFLHPPAFRRRFRDEMMSAFEETDRLYSHSALLLDCLLSCGRQWLLRGGFWKLPAVIGGAFLEVWFPSYRIPAFESWNTNHEALAPPMEELMLLTLVSLGLVCLMVLFLVSWTARFQRDRMRRRGIHHA